MLKIIAIFAICCALLIAEIYLIPDPYKSIPIHLTAIGAIRCADQWGDDEDLQVFCWEIKTSR